MHFEFATANRIVFGPGTLRNLGALAADLLAESGGSARRALIVTGRDPARAKPLRDALEAAGIHVCGLFAVSGEPTVETAEEGVRLARESGCKLVVGFGGGSAVDAGKAIAALTVNPGEPLDYLEVIGRGQSIQASLPYIAIPTTAGTGAEVTRNAVLASPAHRVKVSLRSPHMLPRIALVDPELTGSLPADVTATTGLDALTQLVEPFVSHRANPMTDAICREGIARVVRSLRRAVADGTDADARMDMSLAGLFGGLALANAGLGAVHGFAGPIGGMFDAPHGAVCAALLPHVMAANCRALSARDPKNPALPRYRKVAAIVTGDVAAEIDEGIAWVRALVEDLRIPGLGHYGIGSQDVSGIAAKAAVASSMKGNPLPLTATELEEILSAAL